MKTEKLWFWYRLTWALGGFEPGNELRRGILELLGGTLYLLPWVFGRETARTYIGFITGAQWPFSMLKPGLWGAFWYLWVHKNPLMIQMESREAMARQ